MRFRLPLLIIVSINIAIAMSQACFSDDAFQIHMRTGSFDPKIQGAPEIGISALMSAPQTTRYQIIQCVGPIEVEWRNAIEQSGLEIINYVPDFAFLVRGSSQSLHKVRNFSFVRWTGPFIPAFKIEPELLLKSGPLDVSIITFPGEQVSSGIMNVLSLPERARQTADGRYIFRSKVQSTALEALAKDESVAWIEEYTEPKLFNSVASAIAGVNHVRQDIGLYGKGQILALCDTGLDTGNKDTIHPDIRGRLATAFSYGRVNDWSDPSGHGTHVAGSLLGSGLQSGSNPATHTFGDSFAGMAPDAKLVMQSVEDSQGYLSGLRYGLPVIFQAAYDAGARIHSNSWGADVSGRYTIDSFMVDMFCWARKDMLLVFSAGNAGIDSDGDGIIDTGSIGSPATAKDCIAVGASESLRTSGGYQSPWGTMWQGYAIDPVYGDPPSDNPSGMAAFSGRGPTSDGRIKPDLVAPATNIISCRSANLPVGWGAYNNNYMYFGGTSMATPMVSGTAALVREYYVNKGVKNPSAALLKATLANGAFDMSPGQYGTGGAREMTARPNFVEGWGRVDVANSLCLDAVRSLAHVENATGLATGASATYTYTITNTTAPLRVTLVWTDAPGSTNVLKQLVNDLDLKVTGPTGSVYYGNGKIDRTNNIEGIDIPAPSAGQYSVKVSAYNAPQGPQPFALVVSGGMASTMLSGTITTNAGAAVAGVKITAGTYTDTTDSNGKYAIKLPTGNYTVIPSKTGWAFTPYSKAVTVPTAGIAGVNFSGFADAASISGIVFLNQPSIVQSAHPYTTAATWTVNGIAGASYTSVHFSSIDVENGRDYVQILNANSQIIAQYTGQISNQTSVQVPGASLKIRLIVNGANTSRTGFTTDWVQSYVAGIPVTAQPGGAQSLTDYNGSFHIQGLAPASYTISTAKTGWVFDPMQKVVSPTPGQTSTGTVFAGYTANQVQGRITTLSTSRLQQLTESPHPYGDSYSNTWSITGSSNTARMRVHFNIIDTELYFDLVKLLDQNNNVIETFSGSSRDRWSSWVPGNILKIQLQTDSSYSDYFGIRADVVEMESSVSNSKSGVTVSASSSKKTAVTNTSGYYTLSGLGFGTFGIEPSLKSWSFTPPRKTVALSVGQTPTSKDFRAKASGTVTGKVVSATITTGATVAESPHPYANNYTNTWRIFAPTGASGMRVHFSSIDMEDGYDYIAVCDKSGAIVKTYTGSYTDMWTDWIPGNEVSIVMWSDSLNELSYPGFITDKYEHAINKYGLGGAIVTATPSGNSATTAADGSYTLTLAEDDYSLFAKKTGAAFALNTRKIKVYSETNKPGVDFYLQGFAPSTTSITPNAGSFLTSEKHTFTCKYTDPDGASNIANCALLLNTSLSGLNAVNVSYDAVYNLLYLKDNTNTIFLGGFTPGSANIIENSQCILYCADTTTTVSGNERIINWKIRFKPTMGGMNCMAWMKVFDKTNLVDGWHQMGSNIKPLASAPVNTSLTPSTGTIAVNTKMIFTSKYTDTNGYGNIDKCYLLVNKTLSGLDAVYLIYDATSNKLYIRNEASTISLGGYAPGSANVIENSQFRLYCAETTVAGSGTSLTVNWKIMPKQPMSGKNCMAWMKVCNKSNLIDGWDQMGSNIKLLASAPVNTSLTPSTGTIAVNTKLVFTSKYTDTNGYSNIDKCYLLVNKTLSGLDAVYLIYDATSNKLYIRNEASTVSLGGYAPGSANVIENSQFRLYCAETTVAGSGTSLTVNWKIMPKQPMSGKNCMAWMKVCNKTNLIDGWDQMGSNIKLFDSAPTNTSLTPSTGTFAVNTKLTFTSKYNNSDGYGNIDKCYLLMNKTLSGLDAVYLIYDATSNKLYIRNEASTIALGGYAPGSANIIENSQFRLYCAETTVAGSGTALTINWKIMLKQPMSGKTCAGWLQVTDKAGFWDKWEAFGSNLKIGN